MEPIFVLYYFQEDALKELSKLPIWIKAFFITYHNISMALRIKAALSTKSI